MLRNISLSAALMLSLPVLSLIPLPAAADEVAETEEITEITVNARRVANLRPAGSYATAATILRFDPLTELQSRGLAEGQSDVTVRGGVFENTGFKLGAVTVTDPQTGHYAADLPVDPALMSKPAIYKGIDGAIEGFNSAIATVAYGIGQIQGGGSLTMGLGSDSLNYQALRVGHVSNDGIGVVLSAARSEGDGSLSFGDHDFSRFNVQLQSVTEEVQSDLIVSYQDKFFGWPGAYTGFASLPETDDTQTTLVLANQHREWEGGWFEYGGFYRNLVDDYDFDRRTSESGTPGSFEHETRIVAIGFQGYQRLRRINWRYGGQVTKDELVRSTDLTNGLFTDRTYATLSAVPSIDIELANGNVVTWRAGVTADYSNRESNAISPLFGVSLNQSDTGGTTVWSFEYASTSQLPGYTALNSEPNGLFGGNPLLGREKAKQLSASVSRDAVEWQARVTLFARKDEDLVDWTFATDAPFTRQANPVDIDVIGFEAFITRQWDRIDVAAGYTLLDKDSDYGDAPVDASFYALNFARHRATLALRYRFMNKFELRLDTEYRSQEDNPLRTGDDTTFLSSVSLMWTGLAARGFSAMLVADNLTDSEFQTFPGTPAAGRQVSASVTYNW